MLNARIRLSWKFLLLFLVFRIFTQLFMHIPFLSCKRMTTLFCPLKSRTQQERLAVSRAIRTLWLTPSHPLFAVFCMPVVIPVCRFCAFPRSGMQISFGLFVSALHRPLIY
ncbi:hypothetical protein B6259_07970 [Ruminococcaceae bacterium CPB6]|nr:hypothetical protein B6259_07970 [Ruminococcaceae bacterium CPB6]